MKYEVSVELMQRILDYIGSSSSSMPVAKVVSLVDAIRALKPVEVANEQEKTEE